LSRGTINFVDTASSGVVALHNVAICLHPHDDVAIAKVALLAGTTLLLDQDGVSPTQVRLPQLIPSGHKIALHELAVDQPVHRYGQVIGFATRQITAGEHVHTHNLSVRDFTRTYDIGTDARPVSYVPSVERRTFLGYRRPNGRVGTRNYIAVIASVNCAAHTAREIAHAFTAEQLAAYPNVDGVIAISHQSGCATRIGSRDYVML